MRIDRNNYEEFFILYVDNELTAHDRLVVEEFVQKHPDLEEELVMLKQTKIIPDPHIIFERKEELVKDRKDTIISLTNFEETLLLYTDNELNKEQKSAVEESASRNPGIKNQLDLLLRTRLQPDQQIVFDNKAILYRKEEGRAVRMPWWRIAVAAVLIIAAGTITFTILNKEQKPDYSNKLTNVKKPDEIKPGIKTKIESKGQVPAAEETNQNSVAISPAREKSVSKKQNIIVRDQKTKKEIKNQEEEKTLVVKDPNKKETNNLPDPAPGIKTKLGNTPVDIVNKSEYSVPPAKVNVTERPAEAYYITDASENKTKRLRGFLRKATRILERRANISATDDDGRLLIGGLAVKL